MCHWLRQCSALLALRARGRSRPTPNCIAKRTFRFSKGLRIPTSLCLAPRNWATRPWRSPIATAWPESCGHGPPPSKSKLKLLIGAELTPIDAPAVVVLATDRKAYGRLSRLITVGRRIAPKGECRLTFDDIAASCRRIAGSRRAAIASSRTDLCCATAKCSPIAAICWRSCIAGRTTSGMLDERIRLARQSRLPLVAANDVHFHHPSRRALADVLTATRAGCTVAEAGELLFPNADAAFEIAGRNARNCLPACRMPFAAPSEIADRCTFSLDELRYEYPEELAPPGQTPLEHLTPAHLGGSARALSGRHSRAKCGSCSSTNCN